MKLLAFLAFVSLPPPLSSFSFKDNQLIGDKELIVSRATLLSVLSPSFLSVLFYWSPIYQLNKVWDCVTHILIVRLILSYFPQSFCYLKPRVDQYHILIRIPSQPLEPAMIWGPGQLLSPLLKFGGRIAKQALYSVLQGHVEQASHQTQQSGRFGRYSRARLFCPSPTRHVDTMPQTTVKPQSQVQTQRSHSLYFPPSLYTVWSRRPLHGLPRAGASFTADEANHIPHLAELYCSQGSDAGRTRSPSQQSWDSPRLALTLYS